MSSNPLFQQCVKSLLEGEIICHYRHGGLASYLSDQDNLDKVNAYLSPLNRQVRQTSSEDAWLCAYIDLNNEEAKANVKVTFGEVVNHMEALVQWLRLAKRSTSNGMVIEPGDTIAQSDMLSSIENAHELSRSLDSLTEKGLFKSSASKIEAKLSAVMHKLVDMGYFKKTAKNGTVYQATGKWSWLYDTLDFIQRHEDIEAVDEPSNAFQMEAF